MRILRVLLLFSTILFSFSTIQAQEKKTIVNEPNTITELMNMKKTYNSSITANDKFRIQVFYGKNSEAKEALQNFKSLYPEINATIIYNTPTYKVFVGNFKTRLEAERNLRIIKKDFPNSLLIRPSK
ncbi:SPOR domain-containing protein [Myroides injenensis]|uniref:SPOR domain-containing protein n=1 Tax=Myroides injenensis TaxID=1183151 RepID=UPI00028840B4|nr:SPOR domain-containing protein [Myroides injenensis]